MYFHAIGGLWRWFLLQGSAPSWACWGIHSMQAAQAREPVAPARWSDTQRDSEPARVEGSARKNPEQHSHRLLGHKTLGFSFLEVPLTLNSSVIVVVPLWNHFKESELWDAAMGDLGSSCWGNLLWWHGSGMCRESGVHPGSLSCLLWRGSVPALGACGSGCVTARVAPEWAGRKVSWTGCGSQGAVVRPADGSWAAPLPSWISWKLLIQRPVAK